MAWEPTTGALWTVVNERDGLGDETPPDYLTSVDGRRLLRLAVLATGTGSSTTACRRTPRRSRRSTQPDFALGGHTASLGLCWLPAGTFPGLPEGMAIGQHGSWNRSKLSGYKMTFVPFANGKPTGEFRDVLTGFLSADERDAYGRPVGVAHRRGRQRADGRRRRQRDLARHRRLSRSRMKKGPDRSRPFPFDR